MIMFFLPWWTYVLIGTIAFTCSFVAVWLAGIAFEKSASDDGPFPCLARADNELWCWLDHGHSGPHDALIAGYPSGSDEWPETPCEACSNEAPIVEKDAAGNVVICDETEPLPELPQRLSKVPVQPRPWPGCFHQSSDGRCRLVKSHIGPHDYV